MIEYLEVEQARHLPGLRLVLTRGVPNPWGETAKGIFKVKGIPFTAVSQHPGEPNLALRDWTGQTSGPCAVFNDEPPKVSWAPVLHLAERMEPDPPLLPERSEDRVTMLGLCEELAGEDGLGWNRRKHAMMGWAPPKDKDDAGPINGMDAERIRKKYGNYRTSEEAGTAVDRMVQIIQAVGRQAAKSTAAGERYLIGGRLSALDIMWAGFCGLFIPLPDAICVIPAEVRTLYTINEPRVRAVLTPDLLEHRDFMYTDHMGPPVSL